MNAKTKRASIAALALASCSALATSIFAQGADVCPGCGDDSAMDGTTYPGGNQWFFMGASLTSYNGECFIIEEECVMAYPCTPFVEVWGQSFQGGASATGGGSIGSVGLGRSTVTWGLLESFAVKTFYKDYTGVDCGSQLDFYYSAVWSLLFHADETGVVTGKLACEACSEG
ncbi:MAG: hypothetical protein H6831_02455 [Planctomycetes bacterium]|nr:hypothetical protein [Planctomycetota bacterium]MCB9903244.1 hypothetical protein [Planctomycetota bacterium]